MDYIILAPFAMAAALILVTLGTWKDGRPECFDNFRMLYGLNPRLAPAMLAVSLLLGMMVWPLCLASALFTAGLRVYQELKA